MYNADYPSTTFGWGAFQYHDPNEFNNNTFWYNGQGVANPFANSQTTQSPYQSDSRRYIGQQFAQTYGQQPAYGYGQMQGSQPSSSSSSMSNLFGNQAAPQPTPIAAPTASTGITYSASPSPMFDSVYNNPTLGATWDKSSNNQVPVWNNQYTQPHPVQAPSIDWTASQRPPQPVGYGYSGVSSMNPACTPTPNFAQQSSNWINTVKQNFSL